MRAKPELTVTLWKSRASNLIVFVESEMKGKILHKSIEKRELETIVFVLSRFKGFSPARLLQYHRQ